MPSVEDAQVGEDSVTQAAAKGECSQKFLSRILHRTCRQQKRDERNRRGQERRYKNPPEAPTFEARVDGFRALWSHAVFQHFFAALARESIRDVAANEGSD